MKKRNGERRYFGTDGVRGRVGTHPITPDFVLKLGWAAGRVLAGQHQRRVLIGKDTRISGYMFESALEAGLSAAGIDVYLLGPMPTPGVAYLTRTLRAGAGIVISASHNPYDDNGIKFFSGSGRKLPDEVELQIEAEMDRPMTTVNSAKLGKAERLQDAPGRYIEFCKSTVPSGLSLNGLKVVVDCANGAGYYVAPCVFAELGAEVVCIGTKPDGLNINERCGSTHPEALQAAVQRERADLGVAFDGDGDRVIMVDAHGEVVDGDELLYIIARSRKMAGSLAGGVVGTVMSNLGLERALQSDGIGFQRVPVGDRHIMEALDAQGWILGGEASGHIICLDRTCTGDGIVSALQVLAAMCDTDRPLHELRAGVRKHPQRVVNVPLERAVDLEETAIRRAVAEAEAALGEDGRVLLRPSGTEPVLRVMVEAVDARLVETHVAALADAVAAAVAARPGQAARV